MEQPRTNSGRFGAKPTASKTPASDALKAAAARTGFLVPPPVPLEQLNRARARSGIHSDSTRIDPDGSNAEPAGMMGAMKQWLTDTEAAGALSKDLWRVWRAWKPSTPTPKHALRGHFDELDARCRKREFELGQQAEREQLPAKQRAAINRSRNMNDATFAEAQKVYDKAKAEHDRFEAMCLRQLAKLDERETEAA